MIHSVASWEKTQLLNQRLNSVRLLPSQESLCNCPEHEIIAHRRQSVAERRLSTELGEGRVPLVSPLFAMVILSIGFALMLFACHQGTMAGLSCTLEAFAGRTEESCRSMLQKKESNESSSRAVRWQAHHPRPPPRCANCVTLADLELLSYVVQADLIHSEIHLPPPPTCWDYRDVPPHPAIIDCSRAKSHYSS